MKGKMSFLTIFVLCAFGFIVLLILIGGLVLKEEQETPAPAVKKKAEPIPVERKLAMIDKGYVSEDDIIVTRYRSLLLDLADTYSGTKQQISDTTVMGQKLLKEKYGIKESLLNILGDMNQVTVTKTNPNYAEYATAYVHLRKTGMSRQMAIRGVEDYLKSIGR